MKPVWSWECYEHNRESAPCGTDAYTCCRSADCGTDGQGAGRGDRCQAFDAAPGCSGLAYSVDYVSEAAAFDERIETPGGLFFVDGASVLYLVGSTMDWQEDDFTAGFVFNNPNAKGACGCGESFTV